MNQKQPKCQCYTDQSKIPLNVPRSYRCGICGRTITVTAGGKLVEGLPAGCIGLKCGRTIDGKPNGRFA